jgi:nucleotide-binding universal stress UspA family protein
VVGVDGSPESLTAARWAADEAARRKCGLNLLCSVYLPVVGYPMVAYPTEFVDYAKTQAGSMLDSVKAEITAAHAGLEVTASLTRTEPRTALVDASENVALTVVGCLGSGRVQGVLLGSVALHVSAHGRSPVAVVPYDMDHRAGPVLVGVDGAAHSEAAAALAFDEAALRGVAVVAVMAFDGWARQGFATRPITFDADESREEYAVISEQLAGLAQRYPDVPVHEHLFRGQAADCLLGYAGHAPLEQQPQLIVVGSRGRGGLTGLLLGSTSHTVIAHAACPVVVVRPSDG